MKNLVLEIIPVLINFAGKNAKWIAFLLLVSGFFSCGSAVCENTNPVFDNYEPVSKEYQLELIKQLSIVDKSKLTYWFKEFTELENEKHLHFLIKSKDLCAILVLEVNDELLDKHWPKSRRKNKYSNHKNTQVLGLKYDIDDNTSNPKFVYKKHFTIVD